MYLSGSKGGFTGEQDMVYFGWGKIHLKCDWSKEKLNFVQTDNGCAFWTECAGFTRKDW